MPLYTLAPIDNYEDGKVFFETYNIPYQVITRGENKGKLRVKPSRAVEDDAIFKKPEGQWSARDTEYCALTATYSAPKATGLW